jgi:transposase
MVHQRFQSLSPAGLLIDDVEMGPERIVIAACCRAAAGTCPECGRPSGRVHSRYERRLLDLPSHGRAVHLRVAVRRFRCATRGCRRRTFAERLDPRVAGRSARRTFRLEAIVHHLGIALGGRPAAALARRLMRPVSRDTLLRVVRRPAALGSSPLYVVGLDDWAWKKGQRYGSLICDLERRCVVALLPDREAGTVTAWLSQHPEIRLIARDRAALPGWIGEAAGTVLSSFAKGIAADHTAVAAALSEPWSNGQTEGQITRLKLVRRQMYGRGKLDLLRARLVAPP